MERKEKYKIKQNQQPNSTATKTKYKLFKIEIKTVIISSANNSSRSQFSNQEFILFFVLEVKSKAK